MHPETAVPQSATRNAPLSFTRCIRRQVFNIIMTVDRFVRSVLRFLWCLVVCGAMLAALFGLLSVPPPQLASFHNVQSRCAQLKSSWKITSECQETLLGGILAVLLEAVPIFAAACRVLWLEVD